MSLFGGFGYGGAPYGYSPYTPGGPLPIPYFGGYGGNSYGFDPYGSVDFAAPEVSAVSSLSGFELEVFFSKGMQDSPALFDPSNYTLLQVFGAPCVGVSVTGGTPGEFGGWTSVILTHTGTTLGGSYQLKVYNLLDLDGIPVLSNWVSFLTLGDSPTVEAAVASPDDGFSVLLEFFDSRGYPQPLLTEVQFSPGVDSIDTYFVSGNYPVAPVIAGARQDLTQLSQVVLDIQRMTAIEYDLLVGPSLVYDYLGDVLPDDSPQLIGVEIGVGFSSASALSGLLLSKDDADTYGWELLDSSGRLLPGTTFRVDVSLDASAASISPPVAGTTFSVISVCDGAVQVDFLLGDISGTKSITVVSGAFSVTEPALWDVSSCTVSLVRNQKGGFYSVLFNGDPLTTFAIPDATGAPTFPSGARILLAAGHEVSLFKIRSVRFTASTTLFTSSWNFVHELAANFIGSSVKTRDRVITKRGPLVRGWGDPTPAEKQDVSVRVNGVPVEVSGVNPYVGEIFPLVPIPLTSPGVTSIEVDYIWFVNPALELAGLNTRGLGLNIWDRSVGHTFGAAAPLPNNAKGATKGNRFPMGVALGPYSRPSPKQVAHRYIGFQKNGYSALLNEPTTLELNRNPHAISVGKVTAQALQQNGRFDGKTLPGAASTPWELVGLDEGGVVGDGSYKLVDSTSGQYGVGQAAYYRREFDLSLPGVVTEIGRFRVGSYSLDGVFTGVGLGVYSGNHLFLVGALLISGVMHVGILLNGEDPQLEGSWKIGPSASAHAVSRSQITIPGLDFPQGISAGSRFRIPSGDQAGVYTITECGVQASGGKILLSFSPDLPSDPSLWGGSDFEVLFETPWDTLCSFRAQVSYLEGYGTAFVGGTVSGSIAEVTPLPAYPAQTSLILPAITKGVAFWGSVSRRATNTSFWDFSQYVYTPERLLNTVQGLEVLTEMGVLPQDGPDNPWFIQGGYGYARAQSGQVLVKATSAPLAGGPDLEYAYTRVEPYLSNHVSCDLSASFSVDSGRLGAGDVDILLQDGVRKILLRTLLYVQGSYVTANGPEIGRKLVPDLPEASVSGLQIPDDVGWVRSGTSGSPVCIAEGQKLSIQKASSAEVSWGKAIPDPLTIGYQGLISEAVVRIFSGYSVGVQGFGFIFGCRTRNAAGLQTRTVLLSLTDTEIRLLDRSYTQIVTFPFTPKDGVTHTYRMLIDPNANNVVLVVDEVSVGSVALNLFAPGAETPEARLELKGSGSFEAQLYSTSCIPLRAVSKPGSFLGRTFGILLRGGDPGNIDGYRIPRFDSGSALNSSLSAVPVLMDWRSPLELRVYEDPSWGVSFYRPDIPPPPWAAGNFATQTTNPSEAWFSVEYSELPVDKKPRGFITFGSPDPWAITQSRWDFLRYRIRGDVDGFGVAPQNMVLNRAFTFTSGEFLNDKAPEIRTIFSRTPTLVRVSDSAIYAGRVFVVQVDGAVLPSTGWAFDAKTQVLVLNSPLPRSGYPVTVSFASSAPYTKEYLCSQPLENSPTILNAGTPPVPKSRDLSSTRSVLSETPPDSYTHVGFQDSGNSLYASTQFCEVSEGDDVHIAPMSDGPGPGLGFAEMQISGSFTANGFSVVGGPGGVWGGQSPVIAGSASHFYPGTVLVASGGAGSIGPLGMILYPNARAQNWDPLSGGSGTMGLNQDFSLELTIGTPYEDVFGVLGDNVPPYSADPNLYSNPDGAPGVFGHGAAAYILEDTSSSPFSRLGPWDGLSSLSVRSLLGGGSVLSGSELLLEGGLPLPIVVVYTSGSIEAAN